ncbi:unnamed protein product [Tilletia laevis]|uniref:Uncharacterized protein n=2 Tax=Tilletia TaxID=13289 RepID=A0A177UI89_9BASI|nr:hypothetical protein CF336_g2217 [Tilletia laevis]KAE8253899.1 hypothetical protein A4X03_0g5794 [Tilletia caries]KAE8203236.1 hypothetical protein CF335_g3106 [Tilletia laevis]CAD6885679.1 unnamed protein product [Tilletia caries]CAD6899615.1 unnamed protein product [Tilletia laevis]
MASKRPAAQSPRVSAVGGPRPTPPIRFEDDSKKAAAERKVAIRARQRRKGCCSGGGGFFAFLFNFAFKIGIFYTIISAVWQCSDKPFSFEYSPKDDRAICRNLYSAKVHLTPHLQALHAHLDPHVQTLHAQLDPHVKPYLDPLRPYAQKAYKAGAPIYKDLSKRSGLAWKRYGEPQRREAEKAVRKFSEPHIKRAKKEWKKQVQPHITHAHKTIKPYHDTFNRDVHPHLINAYALSTDTTARASKLYLTHVQPSLIKGSKLSYAFYKAHVLPYLRRGYSLYVRPAVDKALAKVFQRQVGEARREAIKEAMKEADAGREAAAQESASKAASKIAEVVRSQESPTYIEQAKQAVFGKEDPEEALRVAKLDAELDAETDSVRFDLSAWERQHVKLVQQQYRLTLQRVADLRNHALLDLPDRFALLSQDVVQGEVQNVLGRLEKEFEKLTSDLDERSTAEKAAAFNALVEREIEALRDAKLSKDEELDKFYVSVAAEEIDAADAAIKELDLFTVDAKRAYDALMDKSKFEATVEEFVGWDDDLVIRSILLRKEFVDVFKGDSKANTSFGAIDLSTEPKIDEEIAKLKKKTDKVFDAAVSEIRSYGNSASLQLRGDGVRKQISAVSGSIAESASAISNDISAGLQDAIHVAKVKLSLEDDPSILSSVSGAQSAAASAATDASRSANEAIRAVRSSALSAAQAGSEAVRSGIRSAASAAGASVTPETPREYVESAAADVSSGFASAGHVATEAAKDAGASASSLLHRATRSAASAVGASVTPETGEEYVEAAKASATSLAQAASSGAVAGAEAVQSGAAQVYSDAAAGGAAILSQASSVLHQATRSAASAVGASVTPESAADYAEILQDQANNLGGAVRQFAASVSSAGADAVDAAASNIHQATRSVSSAVGATPTPETAAEYVEYAANKVQEGYNSASSYAGDAASQVAEGVAAVGDNAASLLHQATRSASSAVGATPTPETAAEYVEYAANKAKEGYESASSYAGSAASQVAEGAAAVGDGAAFLLHQATRSASSAVGATPTPESLDDFFGQMLGEVQEAYEGATEYVADAADAVYSRASEAATDASSVVHQATRSAASAAGFKPTPEGIKEHFESATSRAAGAAQSVVNRVHEEL